MAGLFATVALVAYPPPPVQAFSSGITTASFGANGCNSCHSGGNAPTVELSGPTIVAKGSTNEYTLSIAQTGSQNRGGLNVSSATGVLAKGGSNATLTQRRTVSGRAQITHTAAKAATGGVVTFSFL